MRKRGMILVGGAAILAALVGGTVEAQDKPCDARPRWLVVTVVRSDLYVRAEDDAGWKKSEVFSKDETGAQMLDRCVGSWSGIGESDAEPPIPERVLGAGGGLLLYLLRGGNCAGNLRGSR